MTQKVLDKWNCNMRILTCKFLLPVGKMQKNFDAGVFNAFRFLHCVKIDVPPVPEKLSQEVGTPCFINLGYITVPTS